MTLLLGLASSATKVKGPENVGSFHTEPLAASEKTAGGRQRGTGTNGKKMGWGGPTWGLANLKSAVKKEKSAIS